jgi:hypothetical protein
VVFGLRARGASLSSEEASRGVIWGGGGLEWPVYGDRGSGGRWHAVRRANAGELMLGQGWERAGAYGRGLVGFIAAGVGVGPSAGAYSGIARARRTCGRVILPKFLRRLSTQMCESCHMTCVRFLPCT